MSSRARAAEIDEAPYPVSEERLLVPKRELCRVVDLAHALELTMRGRFDSDRLFEAQDRFARAYSKLPR